MVGEIIGGRASVARALTGRRWAVTPGVGTVPRCRGAGHRLTPAVGPPGMPERAGAQVAASDPVALASVKEAFA